MSTRYSVSEITTPNCKGLTIHADTKSEAQASIQIAKAWLKAAGRKFKLVFFYEKTSEYSTLVRYYQARIVFQDTK